LVKKKALKYHGRQELIGLSFCILSSIAVIYATGFIILPCIVTSVIYFSWMIRASRVIKEQYGCEIVQENFVEKASQEAREAMKQHSRLFAPTYQMPSQENSRRDTEEGVVCGEGFTKNIKSCP